MFIAQKYAAPPEPEEMAVNAINISLRWSEYPGLAPEEQYVYSSPLESARNTWSCSGGATCL